MSGRWANHEEIGSGDAFEALHSGLAVKLISTPRDNLMTCTADELICEVMDRNTESYDYIPVAELSAPNASD
jgi:hypothetical protein